MGAALRLIYWLEFREIDCFALEGDDALLILIGIVSNSPSEYR